MNGSCSQDFGRYHAYLSSRFLSSPHKFFSLDSGNNLRVLSLSADTSFGLLDPQETSRMHWMRQQKKGEKMRWLFLPNESSLSQKGWPEMFACLLLRKQNTRERVTTNRFLPFKNDKQQKELSFIVLYIVLWLKFPSLLKVHKMTEINEVAQKSLQISSLLWTLLLILSWLFP